MRRRLLLFTTVAIAWLLWGSAVFGQAPERDLGKITGLRVLPDGNAIVIESEGRVGRHSAFVIKNPFRLVVDFDSTAPATAPGRMKGQGDRIREIRVGYANSRTRMVVDFGDRPVPAFKVDRADGRIFLALGNGVPASDIPVKPKSPARPQNRTHTDEKPSPRPSSASPVAGLTVKNAGVRDKLVFLELADRKDTRNSYRLVIDLDTRAMVVKNATMSDEKGNVKRFELAAQVSEGESSSAEGTVAIRGPRRHVQEDGSNKGIKPKYKWGMPAVEQRGPAAARSAESGPFRLEKFQLEARKPDKES